MVHGPWFVFALFLFLFLFLFVCLFLWDRMRCVLFEKRNNDYGRHYR